MLSKLKDKIIVVFGGTSGIGKKIVEIAKKYGAKVYSFSRTEVDVSDLRSIKQALRN